MEKDLEKEFMKDVMSECGLEVDPRDIPKVLQEIYDVPSPICEQIKKMVQRLESIDNAKSSEVLECLFRMRCNHRKDYIDGRLHEDYNVVEQALLELIQLKKVKSSDVDINKSLYNIENRRQYIYDDDVATLFYKGHKVKTTTCEKFQYGTNDFLDEPIENLNDEDAKDNWEHIWDKLTWNEESKSYKYKNWEWIVLDLWR